MGADEENAGGVGGFGRWRRRSTLDGDANPEGPEGVVNEGHREECTGGDSEAGQEESNGNP